MARRPPARPAGDARGRLSRQAQQTSASSEPFPTLADFALSQGGQISVGRIGPIACAAVAADEHGMYAALQRREAETLTELLQRLDAALLRALEHDQFTDEINR